MKRNEKEFKESKGKKEENDNNIQADPVPVVEEIVIEELAVDGICGIY